MPCRITHSCLAVWWSAARGACQTCHPETVAAKCLSWLEAALQTDYSAKGPIRKKVQVNRRKGDMESRIVIESSRFWKVAVRRRGLQRPCISAFSSSSSVCTTSKTTLARAKQR
ncbi:hypothetical protein IE81DRAFT_95579 [Ceraceosorus guamensis]|uniref:Secreted protein n=1 Tax=Ceraceosorus guamensis TaxID=1522189 RepID=A0A316W3G0_9BASI|nr:hypothetical protein IE81DRAFT_95579 [Ceraceosorus guamensis]PWN43313.1 hypothetical protein IE81DRAFT_95579 [Ceraceosorus guamensis]